MSEKFQIHLQGTSDTQQWLKAEGELHKLDSAASDFLNTLKQGVGIDLGGRLVGSIGQLQGMFTGFVERGYEFNKVMAQSEGGIANVLAKFMKLDEQAAKQEASKAMAAIMEWEPKAAGSLQDLTQGFMSTVGAGQAAGITVAQNVELVGKFANALAALGMDASQLTQELRAIFTGNITSDAQLAKTLEITPAAVKSAKDAGTFYAYLNKQLGSLGATANGPSVVLSSLSSAIDKAAGSLSKGLFEKAIYGAESFTEVLDDPAIKKGLEEAGVSIGELVQQGVNLSMWAVQNAPLLLRVADGALRVGSAIAAIKLTTILAGLMLKAQRWAIVTAAVTQNTAALAANSAAATANVAGGGRDAMGRYLPGAAVATGAAAAGNAGGVAMAGGWAAGFKGALGAALPLVVLGLVMKLMSQGGEIMGMLSDWDKTNKGNTDALQNKHPTDHLRDTIGQAATPADVDAARRLGQIMQRDAQAGGDDVLLNQINAIMGAFDQLVGKQVDHTKATQEAEDAEKAFAAAMLAGQAAAGDNAAKVTVAKNAVEALAKKLSEAAGTKIDTSSFEALLKSLEGLDKAKVGEDAMKEVQKLIELAGALRDAKADAAKDAEQQADKQKRAADDLRQAEIAKLELQSRAAAAAEKPALSRDLQARADALKLRADLEAQGMSPEAAAGVVKSEQGKDQAKEKAKEQDRKEHAMQVAALEDEIAQKRADGDKKGEQAAQDRLAALNLARQLEDQLGLARDQAEERARARVANDRAASERDELKRSLGDGSVRRPSGPARLSSADAWGDGRKADGLRGDGSSSIDAFRARQNTPLRDTFQFPALDAFAAAQPRAGGADAVQEPGGAKGGTSNGSNVASAASQAAASAAKMAEASAKADAATFAELMKLRSKIDLLTAQNEQMASQITHGRS